MALTVKETHLANVIGFDLGVCEFLKDRAGKRLERATGLSKDQQQEPIDGLSLQVGDGDEAERIMDRIQPHLLSKGYRAFWSVRQGANGRRKSDEVIALKTTDHFAIVGTRQTDGANYGISNKAIFARLRSWGKRCRFEIVGASQDWVALVFRSLPADLCAFAEEVYRFCPDTVEQGVGLMEERENPEAFAAARRLCPQLSGEMNKLLDKEKRRAHRFIAKADPRWRALWTAAQTFDHPSTEMGIKLLAYEIQKTKYLFLWWD
jgi:hypothetical protein